jgi:hypothetical protein
VSRWAVAEYPKFAKFAPQHARTREGRGRGTFTHRMEEAVTGVNRVTSDGFTADRVRSEPPAGPCALSTRCSTIAHAIHSLRSGAWPRVSCSGCPRQSCARNVPKVGLRVRARYVRARIGSGDAAGSEVAKSCGLIRQFKAQKRGCRTARNAERRGAIAEAIGSQRLEPLSAGRRASERPKPRCEQPHAAMPGAWWTGCSSDVTGFTPVTASFPFQPRKMENARPTGRLAWSDPSPSDEQPHAGMLGACRTAADLLP